MKRDGSSFIMVGVLVACAVALFAAFPSGRAAPKKLDAQTAYDVALARLAIAKTTLDGSHYSQAIGGVHLIAKLCTEWPNAVYSSSAGPETMLQVGREEADELRAYLPSLAQSLDASCGVST